MKDEIEQKLTLKDGRVIYKTHNGFKCWLIAKPGDKPVEVTANYYTNSRRYAVDPKTQK